MSRLLKTSGFLGLTVQMVWGMYQAFLLMPGGPNISPELVGAHAHFGVLGILGVVAGFAVDRFDLAGTRRRLTSWSFVAGQWGLPGSLVLAPIISPALHLTAFLWGTLLTMSMASLALAAWNSESSRGSAATAAPADD